MTNIKNQSRFNALFLWQMSWRMLWRDWRGGELNTLLFGLIIAVSSMTTVNFFTDRIERGLALQSAELIGADLVITSSKIDVVNHIPELTTQQFETTLTTAFRSIILNEGRPQLVEVKAVADNYPLRGALRVADQFLDTDQETTTIPTSGEIWVDKELLQKLNLSIGDSIRLGQSVFIMSKVLTDEPDRGGQMFSIAPRVLMNQKDIEATQLITQGSRVKYRLLIASHHHDLSVINRLQQSLSTRLTSSEKIISTEGGRPELNMAIDSAKKLLGVAAIISVLLAGVAIATVATRFSLRHLGSAAMMRCLGASQATIISLFLLEMLWLAIIGSSIGNAIGSISQLFISQLLNNFVLTQLPPPSFSAIFFGYITGIVMLLGFALPPLLSLKRVPPLHVLRKDALPTTISHWLIYISIFLSISLLLYWQISDTVLVSYITIGLVLTFTLLAIFTYLFIWLLVGLRDRVGISWRYGLASIVRKPTTTMIQVVSFGVGLMVLLLLFTLRNDLIEDWHNNLPDNTPNNFIVNIQSDQIDHTKKILSNITREQIKLHPVIRTRLIKINQREVNSEQYSSARAKRLINREFNLSYATQLSEGNKIVEGNWWSTTEINQSLISIEKGLATELGISLNDTLTFNINGQLKPFTVSSLRTVDWQSFNINFFAITTPDSLKDIPSTSITSVYIPDQQKQQLGTLIKQYPNITAIDVGIIIKRVRNVIDRVSKAVEFVFIFTLLAGLAVLYAAIESSQDQRYYETAMLRTLGANKGMLLQNLIAEFSVIGILSGVLSGLAASSLAWALATFVFELEYSFDLSLAIIGLISGWVVVTIAGVTGTYRILSTPPLESLRRSL